MLLKAGALLLIGASFLSAQEYRPFVWEVKTVKEGTIGTITEDGQLRPNKGVSKKRLLTGAAAQMEIAIESYWTARSLIDILIKRVELLEQELEDCKKLKQRARGL